jgi:type IV secretion/conjugal transfer VirB4 family ATPase
VLRLSRILHDYREAGAVSDLLALWGFVDDTTFLTKAGALGQVFRLRGVDAEGLDHADRRQAVHRIERALRPPILDESVRIYQYLIKRPASPIPHVAPSQPLVREAFQRREAYFAAKAATLFELELYLVVLSDEWATRRRRGRVLESIQTLTARARSALSTTEITAVFERELTAAVAHLHDQSQTFTAQLADTVAPTLLQRQAAFTFFRRLLNYAPHKIDGVRLKYDTHLAFYTSDSTVDCHRDHLDVDGYRVKVLTMKDPPARTFAGMLQDLAALPSAFIACLEWQPIAAGRMRRDIRARQRHHFNRRISLVNYLSPQTKPEEMLVDDSATALVRELGDSLTALEVHGHVFGACSFTVVAYDRDAARLETSVADAVKVFAGHDGALFEESYNLLNSWLAVVPGNAAHNLRRLALLNTNAADLSLLFTHHAGDRTSAHLGGRPSLAVVETDHHTPYFWTLHYQDVGHTLIQGATGSGKSFLCNFLITHAQQYDPFTVVFDLGGSYDRLLRVLHGSIWKVGLTHREFTINPFCLAPTREHLHFLFSFVRVLIQSSGQHQLTLTEDRDLYEAVENLYALDPPHRRLLTLANFLPRSLAQQLHRWVQGGPYAALFDNEQDTLTFQRLQGFDFEGLEKFPMLLEPLLFYVLHRASAAILDRKADATLKLFVLDEAWRFAKDPTVKAYITEALKTWRKRNAAMILATQSGEDFLDPDLLRTVIESCPTKVFLANPGLDLDRARQLFHLNHTEASLIQRLVPRRQALLKRPDLSKVINLVVDPESARIYAPATTGASATAAAPDSGPAHA